jgi:hypothetical protein
MAKIHSFEIGENMMTHEGLIHALEIVGDSAGRIFSETCNVFADYIKQKNIEIEARDAEIRRLRTMIADHECNGVPFSEAYKRKPEPKKQTNLDWLCGNPEELAKSLFCPFDICKHDGEPHITEEDVCYQCLLDWLKEEHTDV